MSVTTTDNPISTTLHQAAAATNNNNSTDAHLRDYDVHLSSTTDAAAVAAPNAHPAPAASNPPNWPTDTYRGMPPYRPINTGLDMASRPWGGNPVGDAFVFTMFTGVFTVAVRFLPPSPYQIVGREGSLLIFNSSLPSWFADIDDVLI